MKGTVLLMHLMQGMERTKKGKFEGGDTAWEEEKLGSYATSEVRLVEIQENICKDIEEGRDQCYALHEEYDSMIEDWWLKHQTTNADLYEYLCVKYAKKCCSEGHFGVDCLPCPGFPDNMCNGNGKCKGSGTRKGNGKCLCDEGYGGDLCDSCADGYFQAYKDDKMLMCSKCHASCEGGCTNAGPKGTKLLVYNRIKLNIFYIVACIKCGPGWLMNNEKECLDMNECSAPKPICSPLQFCVNTEGSYKCLDCDRSCAGCTGDGPDMCLRCASGYEMRDNMCIGNIIFL